MGNNIDAFFKEGVRNNPQLFPRLSVTPRFKFGPDVYNPSSGEWWDVTTPGQWGNHITKYSPFGRGGPLFWK